jgi:hypothetical protein
MDAVTMWRLPSGFAEEAAFDRDTLFQFATWDRLTLHRLRGILRTALADRLSGTKPGGSNAEAGDESLPSRELHPGAFRLEQKLRSGQRWKLRYQSKPSAIQVDSLIRLIHDARAAGSRVVLHTPPVTSIYYDVVARSNANAFLCSLRQRVMNELELEWYSFYRSAGFPRRNFSDWVHLNATGSRRYVEKLFMAVRGRVQQKERSCGSNTSSLKST